MKAVLAWKRLSYRSLLLCRALQDTKLWFIESSKFYLDCALKSFLKTSVEKPSVIILQLPQGPLLAEGVLLKKLFGVKLVADVHTGFVITRTRKEKLLNKPFFGLLKYCDLILVHNVQLMNILPKTLLEKTLVVFDPWYCMPKFVDVAEVEPYLVFPASFAFDEPLEEVITAINQLGKIVLYVTGDYRRKPGILRYSSAFVKFTGYLVRSEYENLLAKSFGIITGTKFDYTLLMSGWEAVSFKKPLVITNTPAILSIFKNYGFFYDWTNNDDIKKAVQDCLNVSTVLDLERNKLKRETMGRIDELNDRLKLFCK